MSSDVLITAAAIASATALRPLQTRAYRQLQKKFAEGFRRILLVAPTGFGKTVLLAYIVARHMERTAGARVLIVVHRSELVDQTVRKLHAAGLEHVGIIQAGENPDPTAPIQVATVQTMLARAALPDATMLVLDEAHHYVAEEWKRIADHYAGAIVLGFTATPERGDGSPLGDVFESFVVAAQARELMDCGDLVECDVIGPSRTRRALSSSPLEAWTKHAGGRQTVIFASGVEEGRDIAASFRGGGITSAFVSGETPAEEREQILEAFRRGETKVLVNVYVLTEGWDCPPVEVCMLARGCGSVATYLQMIGRVLRTSPETGKTRALLIDLRGAVHKHGLPDQVREFSLEGRAIGEGDAPLKSCPACETLVPIGCTACPHCGAEFPPAVMPAAEMLPAPMSKIDREAIEHGFFVEQLEYALSRGWKPGWAAHKFTEKFGRFPAKYWRMYVKAAA